MVAAVETMMYAKQTPWHGEGVYVGDEDVLSAQAIEASGLDWTVSTDVPLRLVVIRHIPSEVQVHARQSS